MNPRTLLTAVLTALAAVAGCSLPPMATPTGFSGTWARGNDRVRTMLAIAPRGSDTLVRIRLVTEDGSWSVRCGWDGQCTESKDGKVIAVLTVRSDLDAAGKLRIALDEHSRTAGASMRYTDECVLAPDGMLLRCETIEKDGVPFDPRVRPSREFSKVADGIADPPRDGEGRR